MIKKESNTKKIIILIVVFFLGVLLMYGVVYKYPLLITNNVTKLEKLLVTSKHPPPDWSLRTALFEV